jgi:imidazolonepropionase-like amidohydrolase
MPIGSVLKRFSWLLLVGLIASGVATCVFYSRGLYPGQSVNGEVLALVGGRIYDPFAHQFIDRAIVVINGREIVSVTETAEIPNTARVLNVRGLTLLPGLIDSHVHFSGIRTRVSDGSREIGWIAYFWRFIRRFPERRRSFIEAGVTTVKSLGDPYPWIIRFSQRIERHELGGPRIFAGGPMFTAPGGHPIAHLRRTGQGDTSYIAQVTYQLTDPLEARAAVDRIAKQVDFVIAVLETRGDPSLTKLPDVLVSATVEAAHTHGLPALIHVSGVDDVATAIQSQADGIEHVPYDQPIDTLLLNQLRASGMIVDPTLQALEQWLGEALRDTLSARRARENTRRLHDAGIPLVAGSDAPSPGTTFGFTLHEELRNLVEVGLTPAEAISSATAAAAQHLGLSSMLGSIAPGKWADIVAVGGDPLTDIAALSDIYLVIADGQVLLDRLGEVRRRGTVIALIQAAETEPRTRPPKPW